MHYKKEARERDITTNNRSIEASLPSETVTILKKRKKWKPKTAVCKNSISASNRVPKAGFATPFWTHYAGVNYLLATLKRIRKQSDVTNVSNLRISPHFSKKVHPMKCPGQKKMLFKGAAGSNEKHFFGEKCWFR